MRKAPLFLGTIGVVVVASVTLSWGGSGERLPTKAESFEPREVERVASPTVRGAKVAKKPKVSYFETIDPIVIPADGRDDTFLTCPKGKAINGYYGTDGGIVADYLAIGEFSAKDWDFGLIDLTGQEGSAFLGIVCLR